MNEINDITSILQQKISFFADDDKEDNDNRVDAFEDKLKREKVKLRLSNSGIPKKCLYENNIFDTYEVDNTNKGVYDLLKSFASDPKRQSYIISGASGLGKTHLAASVIRALPVADPYRDDYDSAKYISMQDVCVDIDCSRYYTAHETKKEIYEKYANCALLIIDELGTGENRTDEVNFITYVLSKRYENMKPTLIFTNLGSTDLKTVFSDRILDRLHEICKMYALKGESYRTRKKLWKK